MEGTVRVHREEDERKEKAWREEAQRAREPRCMDLDESGSEEEVEGDEEEEEVNLEGGKRRKVVRRGRLSKASGVEDLDLAGLIRTLQKLSKENKQVWMRRLSESSGSSEFGGEKNSDSARLIPDTQEDLMATSGG